MIRFDTVFVVRPTDFFSNLVSLDFCSYGPLCKNYYHLSSFDDTLQNKFHFKNDDGKRFVSLSSSNYRWQVLVALVVKHFGRRRWCWTKSARRLELHFRICNWQKKFKVSLWVKNYLQGRCMEFLYNRLKYLNMLKKSQNSDLQRRRSRQERETRRRTAKLLM